MPRYNVNSPVKHGGRIIKSGVLSLEFEEAEPLLISGALSPAEEAQKPISPPATSNDGEGSDGNGAAAGEPKPSATKPAAKSTSKATKAKG